MSIIVNSDGFEKVEPAKLVMLGKDYHDLGVNCVGFLAEEKSLQLLVGDTEENIAVYQYAPYSKHYYFILNCLQKQIPKAIAMLMKFFRLAVI